MILRAAAELGIDLGESVLIGDKASDITAGVSAGVGCNVLVGNPSAYSDRHAPTHIFASVRQVARWFATQPR
jgi:histidinol phosphatase-like enzyme